MLIGTQHKPTAKAAHDLSRIDVIEGFRRRFGIARELPPGALWKAATTYAHLEPVRRGRMLAEARHVVLTSHEIK